MATVSRSLARHWLLGTLVVLSAIFGYANSPLYGADPTPTPNVSTVPKPSLFFTPTPTTTPVIVILTRAAVTVAATPAVQQNGANAPTPATATAPEANRPAPANQPAAAQPGSGWTGASPAQLQLYQWPNLAAPVVDTLPAQQTVMILGRNATADWLAICCGSQQQPGWVMATALQVKGVGVQTLADLPVLADTLFSPGAGAMTSTAQVTTTAGTTALAIQVQVTPTLVWPDAVRQIRIAVTNQRPSALDQLELRYHVLPGLTLVAATLDQTGATVINSPTDQGVLLLMRWPLLAPASTVVATLTLQVDSDVPNGTFFDNQVAVASGDGAPASAMFTLVMPPTDLPHFPAP